MKAATASSTMAKVRCSRVPVTLAARRLPSQAPRIAVPVKGPMTAQSMPAAPAPRGGQGGQRVRGDDQQTGADGGLHVERQHGDQGGDGEEASADAEQSRQRPQAGSGPSGLRRPHRRGVIAVGPAGPQHFQRGEGRDGGERGGQQ
ncbi:hypothetical protein SANTM175S_02904 [Streptomyces antimycoticus]